MAGNSAFRNYVNGNNRGAGLLSVNGTASLAGALTVVKGRGYFYNGSVYDIITGNSVTGAFSGVTLPQSTPLLSFSMLQGPTAVQVTTHARSFTTFASSPVEWAVADYLDRIQHTNSDDLLTVLAEIQNLPASQFSQAFSSLGPRHMMLPRGLVISAHGRTRVSPAPHGQCPFLWSYRTKQPIKTPAPRFRGIGCGP